MNINRYAIINYNDEEPHTAPAAQHIASLADLLRDFCATHNDADDYGENGRELENIAGAIATLDELCRDELVTVTYRDWGSFTINEVEQ